MANNKLLQYARSMEALNKSHFSYGALEKMGNQGNLMMGKQKLYLSAWGLWNILSTAAQ